MTKLRSSAGNSLPQCRRKLENWREWIGFHGGDVVLAQAIKVLLENGSVVDATLVDRFFKQMIGDSRVSGIQKAIAGKATIEMAQRLSKK